MHLKEKNAENNFKTLKTSRKFILKIIKIVRKFILKIIDIIRKLILKIIRWRNNLFIKLFKIVLWLSAFVSICIAVVSSIILVFDRKQMHILDMSELALFIGMILFGIFTFCLSHNLLLLVDSIIREEKYKFSIASYEVVCKLYLDMDEYYLMFIDGEETYIKKSEVKKIVKCKK